MKLCNRPYYTKNFANLKTKVHCIGTHCRVRWSKRKYAINMSQIVSHVHPAAFNNKDMLRMQRLILEGLEVALHLCNRFLSYSGPHRIIDILCQILPTAYFTNTGYWPFYETESGRSICICKIFNILCHHQRSSQTLINLDRDIEEPYYFKAQHINITFTDLEIDIIYPKKDNVVLLKKFEIVIKYGIKQFWNNGQYIDYRYLETIFENVLSCTFINLNQSFNDFSIFIKPHPLEIPLYGHYLPILLSTYRSDTIPQYYIVSWERCPQITIKVVDYTTSINKNSFNDEEIERDQNTEIEIDR